MTTLRHLPLFLYLLLVLGLAAGTAQAGLSKAPAPTTNVVTVGQAYLEKAIRVRDAAPANPDVRLVAEAFRQRGAVVHTLAEEQLTRAALHALLEQVGKAMKPQDSLVFHFSGFSGQAGDAPVLYVQGTGTAADSVKDGSRQIPLAELRQWLAATGAGTLTMLFDAGPGAAQFCGPWDKPGPIQALTTVCVDLPTGKPGEPAEFSRALAAGLAGPADANGDHRLSGDELAGWLRSQLKTGATVFHTGPVRTLLAIPLEKVAQDAAKALQQPAAGVPAPEAKPAGAPVTAVDKLDALLRTLAEQAGDSKALAGLLEKNGLAAGDGRVPVQIAVARDEDLAPVRQQVEKLGGLVEAGVGKYLYVRLAPGQIKAVAEQEQVWSMAASRPTVTPQSR